jgi:CHAT domain-containing protein
VPDDVTRDLMLDLHRHVAAGSSLAEALARAQQNLVGASSTEHRAVAGSFVAFGA